ncbi:hypothetical protein [Brevundimonas guildfordensis]|uniref:Uncharacterized protein n=1 Tax=Brevundimonas guildfordensis TaxID=2762241 RepID=A0ABR8QWT9_9CAUL|nr:hypothetical protein [Brevundimonas guildfordensis]MBD7940016.1 hypothetical protein [Brevundimonas guildfordensis]
MAKAPRRSFPMSKGRINAMIDYNDPIYVEWDNALEGLRAAHKEYRRRLDEASAKAQARATLAVAQARYDEALKKIG